MRHHVPGKLSWVWNSTAREASCPKNHPVLTPRLLNQFGHCSILCKEPNKIFLKFPSTSRSSARVLYFPAFLPTSHSGKMLPLVLAFDNLQGDHCIQSVTLHGMKEKCKVYQNSVCFLIGAFGFIVTVVVTFQKMCTMIGSALDKLGNSQPPKFADLSAPGSSPSGVSGLLICSCDLYFVIVLQL